MSVEHGIGLLQQEMRRRRRADPSFTLRRFASEAGLSSGALSELLSGKRPLSFKLALRISDRLNLSRKSRAQWLSTLVQQERSEEEIVDTPEKRLRHRLDRQSFHLISEWYYYAILSLSEVEGACADSAWIARRLGLSAARAKDALRQLERMGIIEIKDGRYTQTKASLTTSHNVPSRALRRVHSQLLQKAELANHGLPATHRHLSSITMATSRERLLDAQDRIRVFQRELCRFLEDGPKERVYTLAVALFPLDVAD